MSKEQIPDSTHLDSQEKKKGNGQKIEVWIISKWLLKSLIIPLILFDIAITTQNKFLWCIPLAITWGWGLLSLVLTAILVLYLLSSWAVSITNRKVDDEQIKKHSSQCKYCGGKDTTGSYLCSACNSIMWYKMKEQPTRLSFAVFVLENRWQVFVTVFSVFLVVPGTYLLSEAKSQAEKEKNEAKNNSDALRNLMNDLNKVRAQIINLEANAGEGKYDMAVFSDLNITYTNIYWNHKSTFIRLLEVAKKENPKFRSIVEETKDTTIEAFRKHSINDFKYHIAYMLNKKSFDLSFVNDYMDYWNSVMDVQRDTGTKVPDILRTQRKRWANRLYHDLRITSLMYNLLLDREWLLESNQYPLQNGGADKYFYQIFEGYNSGNVPLDNIYYLRFNYKARFFIPLDTIAPNRRKEQKPNYEPLPPVQNE